MYSQLLTTPTVAQYAQPVVSETSYLHLTLSSNYKTNFHRGYEFLLVVSALHLVSISMTIR